MIGLNNAQSEFSDEYLQDVSMRYPWVIGTSLYGEKHYNWYSNMPIGWALAFGEQFLSDMDSAIKTLSQEEQGSFAILQIKEKFGILRVYVNFRNKNIQNVLDTYEDISEKTCIRCGSSATHTTTCGWIIPLCDNCDK